jgi:sulfatase maturation enzyme AslB (radical SAM superfamily)
MKYFCVAHWNGLYIKNNSTSSCCVVTPKNMSPSEFLESGQRKSFKFDSMTKVPEQCMGCWANDQKGLQTVRTSISRLYPDYDDSTVLSLGDNVVEHLEIRESNLCNFACRMCNADDSVKFEREIRDNLELQQYYNLSTQQTMTDKNWQQTLKIAENVKTLILTGGEPFLIKRYYELLEHLIATGRNSHISLRIYTNCSVFNKLMFGMLSQFKNMHLSMSIDAVGRVAEYQRYGTEWKTVEANINRYLKYPFDFNIHSTITAYTILDFERLVDFYLELETKTNRLLPWTARSIRHPNQLTINNLNLELRVKAIKQIDNSVEKLKNHPNCRYVMQELISLKKQLLSDKKCEFTEFTNVTKVLDRSRNQNFEEVFGYKI